MKYINLILIIISLIFLTKGCEVDGIDISLISTPRKLPANPRLFK
jgi:TRAP-type C4-dicarboxylate transport system permease large subunit